MVETLCVVWSEDLLLTRELRQLAENLKFLSHTLGEGDIFSSALAEESYEPFVFVGQGTAANFRPIEDQVLSFLSDKTPVIWLGSLPPSIQMLRLSHQTILDFPTPLGVLRGEMERAAGVLSV